jgi:acetyltransferase-like isoleucine patch superfamily enzyme
MNKISIGHNVTIGIGAVVLKSVSDSEVLVGNPAKPIEKRK